MAVRTADLERPADTVRADVTLSFNLAAAALMKRAVRGADCVELS